ncbi:chromate transporter [Enterovirga rhinocerotis]|uniref:Chromate transporter n=1 Tax=Enterovirga rhinocerotis TaxID=1339210 RepID=A0A4R7BV44_9HYPH|nr:chromate transporter [Enterovirga rhinocerotis]TDR89690.1 chromate transporter [Enterovirga rhinocerotis]
MTSLLLAQLAWRFFLIGFLAIGGANAVVPEMHRMVVETQGWMTNAEFAALFAIANAAPGPNVLIVTLIGWRVAGIPGALVATVAMVGPTSLLTYGVFHLWNRMKNAPWRPAVQNGLSAVTVGLIAATAWILTRATGTSSPLVAVAVVTAAVSYLTKINPLWCFGTAAALGAAGLL